jgi:hypothetical protein
LRDTAGLHTGYKSGSRLLIQQQRW